MNRKIPIEYRDYFSFIWGSAPAIVTYVDYCNYALALLAGVI